MTRRTRQSGRNINGILLLDKPAGISSNGALQRVKTLFQARKETLNIHMSPQLEDYIIQLVMATRNPAPYGEDLAAWVEYGASPRASISLDRCARAHAWLDGRDFVGPEDIQNLAHDVLRHRIILNFEAEAEGISKDYFIDQLISRVAVP